MVAVAWARDRFELQMIRGLLRSEGIRSVPQRSPASEARYGGARIDPGWGSQHVMVRADEAERARAIVAETLAENEAADVPEPVNAKYLADAKGRAPRSYGPTGAYLRIFLWAFGAIAVAFLVFLLVRVL
jgi:hypothetical protein